MLHIFDRCEWPKKKTVSEILIFELYKVEKLHEQVVPQPSLGATAIFGLWGGLWLGLHEPSGHYRCSSTQIVTETHPKGDRSVSEKVEFGKFFKFPIFQ